MSILEYICSVVIEDTNDFLCRDVTSMEIKKATFQLGAIKTSRLDVFPSIFFQTYWSIVGDSVSNVIQKFFKTNMPMSLDCTNIVCIPKIYSPKSPIHFCPISPCNYIYKIMSKIMVNRLRPILRSLISKQ